MLDLRGRQHPGERPQCRHLMLPVHAHAELRGNDLQISHAHENEYRLHWYGKTAVALKHSGYPLGLRCLVFPRVLLCFRWSGVGSCCSIDLGGREFEAVDLVG